MNPEVAGWSHNVSDSLGTMPCNNDDSEDLEEAIDNSGLIIRTNNKPDRNHFETGFAKFTIFK